jgi:hypothetical protein
MHISREYIGYLARELTKRLIDREMISTSDTAAAAELVRRTMEDEFSVESRINEEARTILAQHEADLQRFGASYSEAFKKIKAELVRKHKAVL